MASIDFSEVKKLKEVTLRCGNMDIMWIILALQTITSEHGDLQQISIRVPHHSNSIANPARTRQSVGEKIYSQWMDLDRLLVQSWEARAIRLKIMYSAYMKEEEATSVYVGVLLPEITKRGISELVNIYGLHRFL